MRARRRRRIREARATCLAVARRAKAEACPPFPTSLYPFVIASEAKRSIYPFCRDMDCFASLAMTGRYPSSTPKLSSPAKAGDPVFQRPQRLIDRPRRTGSPGQAGRRQRCLAPPACLCDPVCDCPTGKSLFVSRNTESSPLRKNIPLRVRPKSTLQLQPSRAHKRGVSRSSRT
jgi:hypothetical protein